MGSDARPSFPTALERLRSIDSFHPDSWSNRWARHTRHLIGIDLPEATPLGPEDFVEHWVQLLTDRILSRLDTWIVIDGKPGLGKSSLALWLAAKVKARLGRETGTSRHLDLERDVIYRLSNLVHRVYQSSRANPSVLVVDEACLVGAESGGGLTARGRVLDRILSVGRIQACTGFILHPNIWGISSMIRNRRAEYWLHVERRGLATCFRLKSTVDFRPERTLGFVKVKQPFSRLIWPSPETDPIWADYERNKIETVKQTLVDSEIEAWRIEDQARMRPPSAESTPYFKRAMKGIGDDVPAGARRCAEPGCETRPVGRSARCEKHRRDHVRELTRDRTARYRRM